MDSQEKTTSMTKYFKNFMLCGDLAFFCLLCKETIYDEAYAEKHLRWEKHRKALKSQTCLPQFKSDCIYRVCPEYTLPSSKPNNYYYCIFCNYATNNNTEIRNHIKSDGHKAFKVNPKLITTRVHAKADGDDVIIENIRINQLQWHSIINKQCLLCNVAVTSTEHLFEKNHKIRLVQARINYVDDKYYRKIGDKFQCFACEKAYPINQFDDHFMNHSNNNTIQTKLVNGTNNPKKDVSTTDNRTEKTYEVITQEESELLHNTMVVDFEVIEGLKDDYLDVDKELKQVICKTCKKGFKLIVGELSKHLFSHKYFRYDMMTSKIISGLYDYFKARYVTMNTDHGKARSATAQYGSMNFIIMNAGGSHGYCVICDKLMSASIKVFKTHVSGVFHQGHLELKGMVIPTKHDRGTYKAVPITCQLNSLTYSVGKKAFLVNGITVIAEDSLLLMKRIEHGKHFKKTKCFACDETITPADEKAHCLSWQHKSKLFGAKGISDDEFMIREVRPKLYHCSACNETMPYWYTLKRHLVSFGHRSKFLDRNLSEFERSYSFSKTVNLKTDCDNLHLQLMNAVFNTKYVIKT